MKKRIIRKINTPVIFIILMILILTMTACSVQINTEGNKTDDTSNEQKQEVDAVYSLLEDAYIYAYPLVLMEYTARTLPENQLVHARKLADPESKSVVSMNVDTLYTQVMVNLKEEPMVLTLPSSDRFMQMQVMDAWSNTVAVLDKEGVYAFVKKGDEIELPDGIKRVELPTEKSWIIGRIVLNSQEDTPNVVRLQDAMDYRPLSVYISGGDYDASTDASSINHEVVPVRDVAALKPEEFFNLANELMAVNPPADADKDMIDKIAALNVGPGLKFDPALLNDADGSGWKNMLDHFYSDIAAATKNYEKKLGLWSYYDEPIGDFGVEYTYRAAVAVSGFGANPVEVAIYPKRAVDEDGNEFDGNKNYLMHFDSLPPVLEGSYGFWSVTAYDNDSFLIPNELKRYNINDRSDFKLNDDGSLDVLLTSDEELIKQGVGDNGEYLLPTDADGFHLFLRIYLPDMEGLKTWKAPTVTPVDDEAGAAHSDIYSQVEDAYIYAYPLVLMEYTARTLPENQLVHSRKLADPESKSVVTMNVDTLYTQIIVNLKDEPMVLTLPKSDRFMEIQVMDAWSNTVAALDKEGVYAFVKKGDDVELPDGITKVELPTEMAWVLGRTLLENEDDTPNVIKIQDAMDYRPLSLYISGGEYDSSTDDSSIDSTIVPVRDVAKLTPGEFFNLANELMIVNPPAAADKDKIDAISALNVGPGLKFDPAILNDEDGSGWKEMLNSFYKDIDAGARNFAQKIGMWSYFGEPIGDFGTEYTYRASVAVSGFGANTVEVAMYPRRSVDEDGNDFEGNKDYIMHFDSLPPVLEGSYGFWSVTAYDNDSFLIPNELRRYNVNDRSDFKLNDDGSLDVLLTSDEELIKKGVGDNGEYLLPISEDGFRLYLRIYLPDMDKLQDWEAPTVTLKDNKR